MRNDKVTLPARGPNETVENHVRRCAASIPVGAILRPLIEYLVDTRGIYETAHSVRAKSGLDPSIALAVVSRFTQPAESAVNYHRCCNLCFDPACSGLTCSGMDERAASEGK